MDDREYTSNYSDEEFYAEYLIGRGVFLTLDGVVKATGTTTYEPRTNEYPGSVNTKTKTVFFDGLLTLYPNRFSDGIDLLICVKGEEAQSLLDMFGCDLEELTWVKDDWYDDCASL